MGEVKNMGLPDLVKEFMRTRDPLRQDEIATEISQRKVRNRKDIQMISRALEHFGMNYGEVYERATDGGLAGCRSIPPDYPGGYIAYDRRERACMLLAETRAKWKLDLEGVEGQKKMARAMRLDAARAARRTGWMDWIHPPGGNSKRKKLPTSFPAPNPTKKRLKN